MASSMTMRVHLSYGFALIRFPGARRDVNLAPTWRAMQRAAEPNFHQLNPFRA
jgi:hypothetical protein